MLRRPTRPSCSVTRVAFGCCVATGGGFGWPLIGPDLSSGADLQLFAVLLPVDACRGRVLSGSCPRAGHVGGRITIIWALVFYGIVIMQCFTCVWIIWLPVSGGQKR